MFGLSPLQVFVFNTIPESQPENAELNLMNDRGLFQLETVEPKSRALRSRCISLRSALTSGLAVSVDSQPATARNRNSAIVSVADANLLETRVSNTAAQTFEMNSLHFLSLVRFVIVLLCGHMLSSATESLHVHSSRARMHACMYACMKR